MKTVLLTAAALAGALLDGSAQAADWYILNGQTGACERPPAAFSSPAQANAALRAEGEASSIDVEHDSSDPSKVAVVIVSVGNTHLLFFPNLEACQWGQKAATMSGAIPNQDEIR
jgi:hypothetical protein